MKKTMKSIIAATLALVMLLCSVPAFAAGADETVKWYWWEDNYHEYHYEGVLEEGTVEFGKDTPEYIYYTFDAQEEGYYLMTEENEWLGAIMPEEIKNGSFYGEIYCDEHIGKIAETGDFASLWYLEEGEHIIGFYLGGGTGSPSTLAECGGFSLEYCGKEITDLEFDENSLDGLVIDYDLCFNEHSGREDEYHMSDVDGVTVTFSGGKSITVDDNGYYVYPQGEIKEGVNEFEVDFLGYKENITVIAYSLSHYIKSAELNNVEKYTDIKMLYDCNYEYNGDFSGETVTVTFADGTKKNYVLDEFNGAEIKLDNGRKYYIDVYYTFNLTECDLHISFGFYETLCKYECNVEQASFKENLEWFKFNIEHGTYWNVRNIREAFNNIFDVDSPFELINNIAVFADVLIVNTSVILDFVSTELGMLI
ncbi:MAG: hypothetical protein IJD49_08325 [Clostridia bacterium]|nr:hypothetical protein [Clostridia bacterium]